MRGRKRKSASVKDATGNPGKRARTTARDTRPATAGDAKPAPAANTKPAPAPTLPGGIPRELTKEGKRVWNIIAPLLLKQKLLKPTDRLSLTRYCDTVADYWKVTRQLRRTKFTYLVEKVGGGKMLRFNPLVMVQDRLARRLDVLEDRFGLTPRSRNEIEYRLANQLPQLPLGGAGDPAPAPEPASPVGFLNKPDEDGPARFH